jgi:hypothetical protein
MCGSPDLGKLIDPQYSSQSQGPLIVLIGKTGFVRLRLQFLASTLVIIVNGDPVSIKAVGLGESGNSRPIPLPYSISSTYLATENRIQGPGSRGSNGFQGKLNLAMLHHEVHRFRFPDLLYEKVPVNAESPNSSQEGVFVLIEKTRQDRLVSNHDELPKVGLDPLLVVISKYSQLGL